MTRPHFMFFRVLNCIKACNTNPNKSSALYRTARLNSRHCVWKAVKSALGLARMPSFLNRRISPKFIQLSLFRTRQETHFPQQPEPHLRQGRNTHHHQDGSVFKPKGGKAPPRHDRCRIDLALRDGVARNIVPCPLILSFRSVVDTPRGELVRIQTLGGILKDPVRP